MERTLALAVVLTLLAFPAKAQYLCVSTYAADPEALAASLLPALERLHAAIPSLSPRQERWIKEEMRADGMRPVRAVSSREYALQQEKLNAGSLLASIQILTKAIEPKVPWSPTKEWLIFAYSLMESDADLYLARLVTERAIQREVIPNEWTALVGVLAGETFPLRRAIRPRARA